MQKEETHVKVFNDIVAGYNDEYDSVEIKGFWRDSKEDEGIIKVCGDNNVVHRVIKVKLVDNQLKFYNWFDQERDLNKEIELGVQTKEEKDEWE